jgi:uncharacterized protein (TIGR00730 family)
MKIANGYLRDDKHFDLRWTADNEASVSTANGILSFHGRLTWWTHLRILRIECGSRSEVCGRREIARRADRARRGLVYGGTSVGLMGAAADATLAGGAEVIGVLPRNLQGREIAHQGLTKLHLVGSMHERKALMASLSDAFIALPGGYGTLDEFFEIVTWAQLKIHSKPCILVNSGGYYDPLLRFLDQAAREEFVRPVNRDLVRVARDPAEALGWIERYRDSQAAART